jgi:hypothetical protein
VLTEPLHHTWGSSKLCRSGRPAIELALWSIFIIAFPVLGLIVWCFFGPSDSYYPPYRTIV